MSFEDAERIKFHWGIKIPLRDGIHLNATIYTSKDQPAPRPCVVTLTPYVSDTWHDRGVYFAAHGLPFLVVDVRGRGNSEGEFRPSIQEAKDGFDVIEWIAQQPFCNGKVAMWGGSYAGYNQWATAKEFPPHLATIVPAAAPCRGVDTPMRNNIFFAERTQWLTLTSGRTAQFKIYNDAAFWCSVYRRWHKSGLPFRELDSVLGNPSAVFQEWLAHPEPDAYWDSQNPMASEYARLQIPILSVTGIYDDDQPGALEHYKRYMSSASPAGRSRHYLLIGPWDHAGTRTPNAEFGGLKIGTASVVDLNQLHLDWYAWTMQGGRKPALLKKAVTYYVMGADEWRHADSLEEVTGRYKTYYLDSTHNATDVFASGSLCNSNGRGQPDVYVHDPRDVCGPEIEAEARAPADSLVDQSVTLASSGKQLVYHSAPFESDAEISGFFRLSAWIAIDCPDTDLYASVYEIDRFGGCIRLSTDAIRARYRQSLRSPKLVETRDPLRYDFERFTFVSRQIKRGHRLRLVIAPMGRLVQGNFAQKNYNGGGVVAEESIKDAKPVTVMLFHTDVHPSALHVPLDQAGVRSEP